MLEIFVISLANPAVVKVSIKINSLAERLIVGVAVLTPKAVLLCRIYDFVLFLN